MQDEPSDLDAAGGDSPEGDAATETKEKLNLDVKIETKSACQRHVTVTIPRVDIERYFSNAVTELMPKAAVPGFRAGRAPRKLVEARFRQDVTSQVKSSLLVDSMGQISDDHELSPISEPDFDPGSVVVPDDGPMTFEFDIEVRPEFDLPNWKGLSVERPHREFTAEDIDSELKKMLTRHGELVPHEGPAEAGDYVVVNLTFWQGDKELSRAEEKTIRIRPVLSFRDGKLEGFEELMVGVTSGQTREGHAVLSHDAPNEELRGKKIKAVFEVLDVKRLELPDLGPTFLESLGGFETVGDLKDAILESLKRRLSHEQHRRARQQVLAALTVAADWALPPELLKRQYRRELERARMEMSRAGFTDEEIRAHENELRQNSRASTERSLKEHFILERIAEEEKIEDEPQDYDVEISLIAAQSGESVRRVRSQIEKRGLQDVLRNQIIERKVIDLILSHAKMRDVPFELHRIETEAVDQTAGGHEEEENPIPEAFYPNEPEKKDLA